MDSRSQFAPFRFSNAIGYAEFYSRSHDAVIRVYDETGNVIETHAQKGYFKEHEPNRICEDKLLIAKNLRLDIVSVSAA